MSAFEDFIQLELPRRPWSDTDPVLETVPVRRGAGPRQLDFVALTDGQVLGKISGTMQGVTIAGLGGEIIPKNYIHTEVVAALAWNINHAKSSSDYVVVVYDENGATIIPESIVETDGNNIIVNWNATQAGKAVLIFAS